MANSTAPGIPMVNTLRSFARASVLVALVPALTQAQALTSLTSLYVSYSSRKVTANPTGELKARLDSVDLALFAANRLGHTGEVRRLLAKGNVLLAGQPWTEVADYAASLLLRTDRVVVESQRPYTMRLEQLYTPSIDLTRALTAHATLVTRSVCPKVSEWVLSLERRARSKCLLRD